RDGLWQRHAEHLRLRELSPCTIYQRHRVLAALSAAVDLSDVTGPDVAAFLASKPDPKTRSVYRSHIVTFYRWAYRDAELLQRVAAHQPASARPGDRLDGAQAPPRLRHPRLPEDPRHPAGAGAARPRLDRHDAGLRSGRHDQSGGGDGAAGWRCSMSDSIES